MKGGAFILNVILLMLVGILFYWHFSSKEKPADFHKADINPSNTSSQFRIAYFEMDSITNSFAMVKDVKSRIEEFLKEYNKSKGYSYIFSNEPGFIYYRDTMFNITKDLVKGLNEQYLKKK